MWGYCEVLGLNQDKVGRMWQGTCLNASLAQRDSSALIATPQSRLHSTSSSIPPLASPLL